MKFVEPIQSKHTNTINTVKRQLAEVEKQVMALRGLLSDDKIILADVSAQIAKAKELERNVQWPQTSVGLPEILVQPNKDRYIEPPATVKTSITEQVRRRRFPN